MFVFIWWFPVWLSLGKGLVLANWFGIKNTWQEKVIMTHNNARWATILNRFQRDYFVRGKEFRLKLISWCRNFSSWWTKAWRIIKAANMQGWLLPHVLILSTFLPFLLPVHREEQDQRHSCSAISLHPGGVPPRVKHTRTHTHKRKHRKHHNCIIGRKLWHPVSAAHYCWPEMMACLQVFLWRRVLLHSNSWLFLQLSQCNISIHSESSYWCHGYDIDAQYL